MRKDLKYYLGLNYKVIIEKLPEKDGGGYFAYIKELGKFTCNGTGDTPEEAHNMVINLKDELIKNWHKEGKEIPEPEGEILQKSLDNYLGMI